MVIITNILEIEQHLDGITSVIFDLDDTLYSEKQYVRSGYKAVAKRMGNKALADKLWRYFEKGKPAIDELLNEMNCKDKKAECLEAYRFQKPDICLYDGVNELLERLKHNYKLGLITDGRPEGQKAKIKVLGLDKYFDEIIITDELGGIDFRKPNPRAFQILAERFREEYNRMCYIGDNIHKDFIAPEMLGMEWIWFRNPDGLYSGEKQ